MKKIISILFGIILSLNLVFAQDAYKVIENNTNKAGGVYYVEEFNSTYTAPKGYKPFYISTYGRHGARYILKEDDYSLIYNELSKAFKNNNLTDEGKAFYKVFMDLYPSVKGKAGELTSIGWNQQKAIAENLYKEYKPVFKANPHIKAFASTSSRVIQSMAAFCERLKEINPRLDIVRNTGNAYMPFLNPYSASSGIAKDFDLGLKRKDAPWVKNFQSLVAKRLNINEFTKRFFINNKIEHPEDFMFSCFYLASDAQCINGENLWKFFNEDEILGLWECDNYKYYAQKGPDPTNYGRGWQLSYPILNDIIEATDKDINNNSCGARLRFGHDGCLMGLFTLMQIGTWDKVVTNPEQVKDVWQTYNVPMASNLQLIFYRNKSNIIFKAVYNGKNLKLPFESVQGPYYDWTKFKEYYRPIIEKAQKSINQEEPTILSGEVSCNGKPVAGVDVSDGINIVKTDENGQYKMFSDKRQGFVFITVPSGYKPKSKDGFLPVFYSKLSNNLYEPEVHNFEIEKQDQSTYSVVYLADIHLTNSDEKQDIKEFHTKAMPNIRSQIEELSKQGPVYAINLGDLSHELFWGQYNYNLKDALNTLKQEEFPTIMYSVSGNHDNDGGVSTKNTDRDAEHLYRELLGPEYYAINIGNEHWIMMDNIIYVNNYGKGKKAPGVVGDRTYKIGFTKDEMEWLANDLKNLDNNQKIRICVHSPITSFKASETDYRVSQMDSLATMFARFGSVDIMCGHVHKMYVCNSTKYPMFKEVAVPAISGHMWTSRPISTIAMNGEDAGVLSSTFSDGKCKYDYVTHIHGRKILRAYDMNTVADEYSKNEDIRNFLKLYPERLDYSNKKYRNWVYVNYWCYQPGDVVEMMENGKLLEVVKLNDEDPILNINYYIPEYLAAPIYKKRFAKVGNRHLFGAKASNAKSDIDIIIKNKDGKLVYSIKMKRPKPFTATME